MERRTDLALEVRESFEGDGGEIEGVSLEKERITFGVNNQYEINVSTVVIMNEKGRQAMKKPEGSYITIETGDILDINNDDYAGVCNEVQKRIESLAGNLKGKKILVAGLGNRFITSDSLGPKVIDNLYVTGHYARA